MKHKQIEVYNHYKGLYPEAIVLFHVGSNYVALFDDAKKVAESLSDKLIHESVSYEFPDSSISRISIIGELYDIRMIDYRNAAGDYDFPDVGILTKEANEDY